MADRGRMWLEPPLTARHQSRNIVATFGIGRAHDPTLSKNQRVRLVKLIRLARRQGGLRCCRTYVVACHYCEYWMPLEWATLEHLVNRRDGGTLQDENVRLVHFRCNQRRNVSEQARLADRARVQAATLVEAIGG